MKFKINPVYAFLKPFVVKLAEDSDYFWRSGTVVHAGRNNIRIFEWGDGKVKVVVKRYGHISLVNRLVYGVLRKSKSVRSFEYAGRLSSLGIDSPIEVAALDMRKGILLDDSYFVSLYSDRKQLSSIIDPEPLTDEAKTALKELAKFLFFVHEKGVLHNDLNISNILHEHTDGKWKFELIDTNRMNFRHHLSLRQRLLNLRRLSCPYHAYIYLLGQYAEIMGLQDTDAVVKEGVRIREEFERKRAKRKRVLKVFHRR